MKYLLSPKQAGLLCTNVKEKTARNVHRFINCTALRIQISPDGRKTINVKVVLSELGRLINGNGDNRQGNVVIRDIYFLQHPGIKAGFGVLG